MLFSLENERTVGCKEVFPNPGPPGTLPQMLFNSLSPPASDWLNPPDSGETGGVGGVHYGPGLGNPGVVAMCRSFYWKARVCVATGTRPEWF